MQNGVHAGIEIGITMYIFNDKNNYTMGTLMTDGCEK